MNTKLVVDEIKNLLVKVAIKYDEKLVAGKTGKESVLWFLFRDFGGKEFFLCKHFHQMLNNEKELAYDLLQSWITSIEFQQENSRRLQDMKDSLWKRLYFLIMKK